MEVAEFRPQNFYVACSEQCIWVFRGSKQDFVSGLLFWVKTLQAQGWEGRESYFAPYAEDGLCQPITESEFAGLVGEYSGSLRQSLPSFLRDLGGYQSGLQMDANWNDVGLVDELLAVSREHGFLLDWQAGHCRVRFLEGGPEGGLEVPLRKSVLRAALARVAVLSNQRNPNPVSPYGGQGELIVGTDPTTA